MSSILIADEEAVVCESCERILAKDEHRVDPVQSGEQTLEKIEDKKCDVVIADLKMLCIDGLKLGVFDYIHERPISEG